MPNAEGQTVGYSYTSGGDAPACSTNLQLHAEEWEVAGGGHEEDDDERQVKAETRCQRGLSSECGCFGWHRRAILAGGFHPPQDLLVRSPHYSPNVEQQEQSHSAADSD